MAVTVPEPKAATRTQAAAISRAMLRRGSSGSPMARGQGVHGGVGELGDQHEAGGKHQQAPAPLVDAQEGGGDGDQSAAIAVGEEAGIAPDRVLQAPDAGHHLAAGVAAIRPRGQLLGAPRAGAGAGSRRIPGRESSREGTSPRPWRRPRPRLHAADLARSRDSWSWRGSSYPFDSRSRPGLTGSERTANRTGSGPRRRPAACSARAAARSAPRTCSSAAGDRPTARRTSGSRRRSA